MYVLNRPTWDMKPNDIKFKHGLTINSVHPWLSKLSIIRTSGLSMSAGQSINIGHDINVHMRSRVQCSYHFCYVSLNNSLEHQNSVQEGHVKHKWAVILS